MVEPLIKRSRRNFDDTVALVEKLMVEEGFVHMLSKNIDEVIKTKLDVKEYSRYTIILGCSPQLAKSALDISKLSGLLFPCSFTVFEEDGEVKIGHVSIMKIIPALGFAPNDRMQPIIDETGDHVRKIWDKL